MGAGAGNPGAVLSALELHEPKLSTVVDRRMLGAVMHVLTRRSPVPRAVPDLGQAIADAAVASYQRDYGRPPADLGAAVAQYGGAQAVAGLLASLAAFSWMGWTYLRASDELWVALRSTALAQLSKGPISRIIEAVWTWVLHTGGLLVRQHMTPRMVIDLHVVRVYFDPHRCDSNWRGRAMDAFAFLQNFAICTSTDLTKMAPPTPVLTDVLVQGNSLQATIARNVLNVPLLRPKAKDGPDHATTAGAAQRVSYFHDSPGRVILSNCAPVYSRTQRALLRVLFLNLKRDGRHAPQFRSVSLGVAGDLLAEADYPGRSIAERLRHLAQDLSRVIEQDLGGNVSPPIGNLTTIPMDLALKIRLQVEVLEPNAKSAKLVRSRAAIELLPAAGEANGTVCDLQSLTLAVAGIGPQFRSKRIRAGISQSALARAAKVAVRTIQRVEAGKAIPNPATAAKLAQVLNPNHDSRNPARHVAHPEPHKATRFSPRTAKGDAFLTPGCNVEVVTH
jgi:DNA-binding XRE family transcriptional regulator